MHTDLIFTVLENSEPFDSYDGVAEDFMIEHFGIDKIPRNVFNFVSSDNMDIDDIFISVTHKEIKYALDQQSSNKAPGPDVLNAIIIKNLFKYFPELLKAIFSKCLSLGHFPTIWKRGYIIFFRKRNKDPASPRAYKPITLLSIFGKVLERIIKLRLMVPLETGNYFDEDQYGFCESQSTIDAMKKLKQITKTLLGRRKYCVMTSLDRQGAFDNVSWHMISEIIESLPLPKYIKNVLKNYISNRSAGFRFIGGVKWYSPFPG